MYKQRTPPPPAKTLLFLLLTNVIICLKAQTPTYWETGGNSAASSDFIGTTNAEPLNLKTTNTADPQSINFYTNNVARMRIAPDGNVGIGAGGGTYNNTLLSVSRYNATGSDFLRVGNTFVTPGSPPTVTTNDYFIVKENGSVGIGTASPDALLHLTSNKPWVAYNGDVFEQRKIVGTNAEGEPFFFVSDMSHERTEGHAPAGFLGLATVPGAFALGAFNLLDRKFALGVFGEGLIMVNVPSDESPIGQVDIRPITGTGTVLNIGNSGTFPLLQVAESGAVGIGMPPQTTSALGVYEFDDAATNLDVYEHSGYRSSIRFMNLAAGTVRHKITEDASGNLVIDAGVTSGGASDKLKVDGELYVTKNTGIGIDVQTGVALAVKGSSDTKLDLVETTSTVNYNAQLRFIGSAGAVRHLITENADGELLFDIGFGGGAADKVVFAGDARITGKLSIGNEAPDGTYSGYMLGVDGNIVSKKVIVQTSSWSDKVFAADYNLRSLSEIEDYIKQHNHLPEIPSEAEVLKGGVDVGEMNKLLLQKVEELTLYIIAQQKQIDALTQK